MRINKHILFLVLLATGCVLSFGTTPNEAGQQIAQVEYPDGTFDETTYDAEGRRLTYKDRAGRVTRSFYDDLGRLVRTQLPDNTQTTTVYDIGGRVTSSTDALGRSSSFGVKTFFLIIREFIIVVV